MAKYQGRRMVKNDLIAQIGQGGSDVTGTNDGTNWTSLTIDDDTYGIPQGDVASDQVIINERYAYTDKPADYSDLASFLAKVPILATNNFTDAETFGHPVIDLTVDTFNQKYAIVTGWFGIRNTANNTVQYYVTATANVTLVNNPTYKDFQIERTGSNDFVIKEARNNGQFNLTDGITSIDVMRFTRSDFQNVGVGETGITRAELMLRINNPKVNASMPTTTPNVQGKYVLNCNVDSDLLVDAITWEAPITGTSIYAHTANFVLNDGSSGDSYTVTMQFNYGTQTGLDAVAFEGLFDSNTGEFVYPYTAYFTDGQTSTLYPCRLTFGGTLFVLKPFPNADHAGNIIDLELEELGFSDVGIAY